MSAGARPRLLDLFCGAGGAAVGYHRAGFDVVGVDIKPQPRYPFEFHQGDAMTWPLDGFDAVHASPPCQAYTAALAGKPEIQSRHPDLVAPTRQRLQASGLTLWIMENVEGAPMTNALTLCGSMFDLGIATAELRRHRLFEFEPFEAIVFTPECRHGWSGGIVVNGTPAGSNGRKRRQRAISVAGHGSPQGSRPLTDFSQEERREAMGIDWMNRDELSQAIPPAYTEWIGAQLIAHLKVAA